MQTFRCQLKNDPFGFFLNIFPSEHGNEIFVQLDSGIFVFAPMEVKTAILARDSIFHVKPHIYIVALTNCPYAVFAVDFYFHFYRQLRLNAAFCNATIICPHDGAIFRQNIDRERCRMNVAIRILKQPAFAHYAQFSAANSLIQLRENFLFVMITDIGGHGLNFGKHDRFG